MVPIKDIVSGDINHPRSDLLANLSQVPGGVNVELPGSLQVGLDFVWKPLSCCMNHVTRLEVHQKLSGGGEVSEVQGGQVF